MEFVQGGELFTHIRKTGRFSNETARFYLAQVVLALEALHKRSIIYRDVKPENLMLDSRGYLRLVDFGFSKRVAFKTYTLCGTPEYVSPEMLLNRGHDRGVDWWAAGILLFEMLAGQPPFIDDDPMGVYGQIIEGRILFPKYFERGARSLIKHLLQPDPSKRYGCLRRGASDVREHRFFTGVDWDALYGKTQAAPILPAVDHSTDITHFDPYPDSDEEAIMPVYEGEDPFTAF
jgi:serine/threonine protein kinase